ncbi:hypothetical protein E6W91_19905 [Escherichia coli]|nr:hypothetical protein [Escherichia coli]
MWLVHLSPGRLKRVVAASAPGKSTAGKQAAGGAAETGGCASSCLSESGLTTGCRQAAGSRSGRCDRKSLNVLFYIDKTSYPISCSLPGQALPATAGSEAPGTTRAGRQPG